MKLNFKESNNYEITESNNYDYIRNVKYSLDGKRFAFIAEKN